MEDIQCSFSSPRITSNKGRARERSEIFERRATRRAKGREEGLLLLKGELVSKRRRHKKFWTLTYKPTQMDITHIFMWQAYVSLTVLEEWVPVTSIQLGQLTYRALLFCLPSILQPLDRTLHLVDGRMGRGKERKTKAIDINDLPAKRGPQAGASEGPLDNNWSWEAQAFVLILTN